jgi:DNA-binding protein YbaB
VSSSERAMADLEQAIAALPDRLADATAHVTAAGAATITGADESGSVTVTALGTGQILSVRVSPRALRELDARALASQVHAAINAVLAKAEAALTEAAGATGEGLEEQRRFQEFEQRMDRAMDSLDELERAIDRLAD